MRHKTNTKEKRLALLLKDESLAAALTEAGYDTPAKIRKAGKEELEAVKGVGSATRKMLKERWS